MALEFEFVPSKVPSTLGPPIPVTWEALRLHEDRHASAVVRIYGLDGEAQDFIARSVDGAIRVEPWQPPVSDDPGLAEDWLFGR